MDSLQFHHYSVLLNETIEALSVKPDGIYVDGTLGGAGHAYQVCKRLTSGHFYGIDQDEAAIVTAGKRLKEFGDRVTILRNNYCNAKKALNDLGVQGVDGIVLDLGVSSYQLDTQDRGFSCRFDGHVEMIMGPSQILGANCVLNTHA